MHRLNPATESSCEVGDPAPQLSKTGWPTHPPSRCQQTVWISPYTYTCTNTCTNTYTNTNGYTNTYKAQGHDQTTLTQFRNV